MSEDAADSGTGTRNGDDQAAESTQPRRSALERRRASRRQADSPDSTSSDGDDGSSDSSQDGRRKPHEQKGRARQRQQRRHGTDDDDSSDDDASSESESDRSRSESRDRRKYHTRHGRRQYEQRGRNDPGIRLPPARPGNIKNLELPTFTPAPGVSAATWVDRIDLALQGANASGQGEWTDHALYFILGNKLMESAAMWWVTLNQGLTRRQQSWTYLKKQLLKRFGPRKNKAAAEWRVNNRSRLYGEPYSDFAEGLRKAADRNRISERVFLAQYYRNLDVTTRQLVRMKPTPKTLEEAVAKTNRIDDPSDNVAQGIRNVGHCTSGATGNGTTGQTVVIPGVGDISLPTELTEAVVNSTAAEPPNKEAVTVFTNQQGIWNDYAGIYERPPGQKWNGRFWEQIAATRKARRRSPSTPSRIRDEPTDEEPAEKPASRKRKSTAKPATTEATKSPVARIAGVQRQEADTSGQRECLRCGSKEHYLAQCPDPPRCYACSKPGHFAKECTDTVENRKRALAARRAEKQRYDEVAREVDQRQRNLRKQQVDEALEKLKEWRQRDGDGSNPSKTRETAKVSLDQRQR
ncbi:LOW QUALITY PROTEIN: hypothetical protein PHMEG_00024533 [Phytophthora megakarya]|uniref:CCHC-type domain-containing protein n=1 Tax=Phytophthora megakarya TaxID=4795 RepID=A0A225VFI9_9STRA|nr:LOW QUALITY PROTEIN: hypothetical protein PHMEG_00024533 [Phytophthora megakarya]